MIEIFSWKNKRINKKELSLFIDFYEKNYLFTSKIVGYEEKKEELLHRRTVNCIQFTRWIKENYPEDAYSKCYWKRKNNIMTCSCRTMYGGIEYIHIWTFSQEIISTIEKAVDAKTEYLVIDLRDNCGGAIEVLIKTISYFLRGTGTLEIQDKNALKEYKIIGYGKLYRKIFILVNGNTMSCAEIMMMVLYENMENIYIVGGPTYMKDTGQITIQKGNMVLSITNFYWYVSGKNIKYFWEQSGERIIGIGEEFSEQHMMQYIYSHLI